MIKHFNNQIRELQVYGFLIARESFDAEDGRLDRSRGPNRFISTGNDDVRSLLSCTCNPATQHQLYAQEERRKNKPSLSHKFTVIVTRIFNIKIFKAVKI